MNPPTASSDTAPSAREPAPFAAVLALGRDQLMRGTVGGALLALLLHGSAAARGASTLVHLSDFSRAVRDSVRDDLRLRLDIEMSAPEP